MTGAPLTGTPRTGAPLTGTAAPVPGAPGAPASGSSWPLAGALLVVAGGWLLARQVVALSGASLTLLVGAVLVLGWSRTRRPVLLVTGAPLTGAAAGLVVGDLVPAGSELTLLLVGLAAGYGAAALAEHWAVLPATGAAALALATSDLQVAEVLPPSSAVVALGVAAVGLGAVLVLRPPVPRAVVAGSSAALLVLGVTALAAVAQTAVPGAAAGGAADLVRTVDTVPLPRLEGRRLVVLAPTAEAVLLNGPVAVEATVHRAGGRAGAATASAVEVTEHEDRVEVRAATVPGGTVSLVLTLDRETAASLLGGTGDVVADLETRDLEIDTTSGAVSASLSMAEGDEVLVRSDTGDVDVRVAGAPRLTAQAASLFVDGYGEPRTGLQRFSTPTGAGVLTAVSRSGRAAVVAVAARPGAAPGPGPGDQPHR